MHDEGQGKVEGQGGLTVQGRQAIRILPKRANAVRAVPFRDCSEC